jgi:hypothetical protein
MYTANPEGTNSQMHFVANGAFVKRTPRPNLKDGSLVFPYWKWVLYSLQFFKLNPYFVFLNFYGFCSSSSPSKPDVMIPEVNTSTS